MSENIPGTGDFWRLVNHKLKNDNNDKVDVSFVVLKSIKKKIT